MTAEQYKLLTDKERIIIDILLEIAASLKALAKDIHDERMDL